jgi:hypothetical protein
VGWTPRADPPTLAILPIAKEAQVPSFEYSVSRDQGWWMIAIPAIDGLTQARFPGEIELMAREYIAVASGTPIAEIDVQQV